MSRHILIRGNLRTDETFPDMLATSRPRRLEFHDWQMVRGTMAQTGAFW